MHRRIFAVGDSHSRRCFENHPSIADSTVAFGHNKLDGRTAYNLSRHEKRVRKITETLRDRHLIFVFGEVDVRIHIKYKHRQTGRPVRELIRNTARRYTRYVAGLRNQGYRIHVFNVVPTGDFSTPEARRWRKNLAYPFLASHEERTAYTEAMNRELALCCARLEIPFIDIYRHLVDGSGRRRPELVFDFSHLNNRTADLVLAHYDFDRAQAQPPARHSRVICSPAPA